MRVNYSVVVLAAGKGSRTHLEYNKVFYRFADGKTILEKSVERFLKDCDCQQVVVVTTPEEIGVVKELLSDPRILYTYGGTTRQDSVYQGLQKVNCEYVMIHDGARCFVSEKEIQALKVTLEEEKACLLMVPAIDTIKKVVDGYVVETPLRSQLYYAQTPQCFLTTLIKDCYQKAKEKGLIASDDASLVELCSDVKIKAVQGEYSNKKVTTREDLKG